MRTRPTLIALGILLCAALDAPAQESMDSPPTRALLAAQSSGSATQAEPAQPARPADRQATREGQPAPAARSNVNIRIDATVIEHRGETVVGRKTLTVTLADGASGSVRSRVLVPAPGTDAPSLPFVVSEKRMMPGHLNMDATAMIVDRNLVRVSLTLDASGSVEVAEGHGASESGIRQSVTVVLEPDKPLIVAQSADAVGERRLALEVKASLLR